MKLNKVKIKNYRCHKELEIDIDDLTILLGPNGSGKSAVIYALDWFFTGEGISESDIHGWTQGTDTPSDDIQVEVSVEFTELSMEDRNHLGKYGRKETAHFTRMWKPDGEDKLFGNSLQGPGFGKVRNAGSAGEAKEAYNTAREIISELPAWKNRQDALLALDEWESKPENRDRLEEIQDEGTSHLYGFTGRYVLEKIFRMIFVPAAMDISAQVGEGGRGSILNTLIGEVTKVAVAEARNRWMQENQTQMEALSKSIQDSVRKATTDHEISINRHLSRLVKDTNVVLRGESPDWDMRGEPLIRTDIAVNGQQIRLDHHGHGVQRAAVIAILQALVDPTATEPEPEYRPSILLALEEPEIYQHPIRARLFGRVLGGVGNEPNTQVLMATHSPYFIRPRDFSSLRRFRVSGSNHSVSFTEIAEVAELAGVDDIKVRNTLERNVASEFSEAYFAEKVVLVEGITDKVVIQALAEVLDTPLDSFGISVVEVLGKNSLKIPYAIFTRLGIPAYVVVDGDYTKEADETGTDNKRTRDARETNRQSTGAVAEWLFNETEVDGTYQFGDPTTVRDGWTVFQKDLEEELDKWEGFTVKLGELNASLRGKGSKNPYAYKAAVYELGPEGIPSVLRELIEAIVASRSE